MRSLFVFLLALAVLGLAAFGVWSLMPGAPVAEDLGPFRGPLLEETADAAVEAVPRAAAPDAVIVRAFRGDVRELAGRAVAASIANRGLARVVDPAAPRKPGEPEVVPGAVTGEVTIAEDDREGTATLELVILDGEGKELYRGTTERMYRKGILSWPYVRSRILGVSLGWRLLAWLLFTIALPIVLSPLLMRRLKRESNVSNALSVVVLTLASALALWFALAFSSGAWTALAVGVLGFGAGGVYHFLVLEFLEDLRR